MRQFTVFVDDRCEGLELWFDGDKQFELIADSPVRHTMGYINVGSKPLTADGAHEYAKGHFNQEADLRQADPPQHTPG